MWRNVQRSKSRKCDSSGEERSDCVQETAAELDPECFHDCSKGKSDVEMRSLVSMQVEEETVCYLLINLQWVTPDANNS